MTMMRLDYIHEFRDRHGKVRRYFRRRGFRRVPLPGAPGSEEFMSAYQAAMAGQQPEPARGASRTKPGTVNAAVVGYFTSLGFRSLSSSTQTTYRGILENFRAKHGEKRIALLARQHVDRMLAEKAGTPAAANNLMKLLRVLMAFAIAEGMRRDDPTAGLKKIRIRSEGFLTWDQRLIERYRAVYPLGTRERLALELLAKTGQRRSDVVRMGRQHVRDGVLSFRQQKTKMLVEIPVLLDLQAAIDAMPKSDGLTFLLTDWGKPFSAAGFGNWFRGVCRKAGVPEGYSAHGLRKAAATEHADRGATAHQLMAWFGWSTIREAERYTTKANRKALAQCSARLLTGTPIGKPE